MLIASALGAALGATWPARGGEPQRGPLPAFQVITTPAEPRPRAAVPRPSPGRPAPPALFEPLPDEQNPLPRRPAMSLGVDFRYGFTIMVRCLW
jgi:hypothetical protein